MQELFAAIHVNCVKERVFRGPLLQYKRDRYQQGSTYYLYSKAGFPKQCWYATSVFYGAVIILAKLSIVR